MKIDIPIASNPPSSIQPATWPIQIRKSISATTENIIWLKLPLMKPAASAPNKVINPSRFESHFLFKSKFWPITKPKLIPIANTPVQKPTIIVMKNFFERPSLRI